MVICSPANAGCLWCANISGSLLAPESDQSV